MPERSLVIGCGALAHEIQHLKELNEWHHLDVQCLDAYLHNTPEQIPGRLAEKLRLAEGEYDRIFIAYADCGTAGEIDKLIEGASQRPSAQELNRLSEQSRTTSPERRIEMENRERRTRQ